MDDPGSECNLSDHEMLDDASEEALYASFALPLHAIHEVNEDILLEQTHYTEPTAPNVNHDEYAKPTTSDRLSGSDDNPASPHADAPAPSERGGQQDISKSESNVRSDIMAKIEGIFEAMVDALLNERGQLSIALRTRPSSRSQQRDSTNAAQTYIESVQHLCFPGRTEKEAWRFGEPGMRSSRRHNTNIAQLS